MIPNFLSAFRMISFLPVIILFSYDYYLTSFFLFTAAAWSDFLDGFLARRYNITSNLGSLLDLLADKILVSSILIFFVFYTGNFYLLILTVIIVLREISISTLRLFLVSNGVNISNITPDKYGKLKTFLQMFSLSLLLIYPLFGNIFFISILILLLISTFFSLISFLNYLKIWSTLKEK
ncbi:MAG: CDP-diacylglycerol--glycerol-3-phosphate 3-phosphatidyltransferase [Gammaproteobacteria bacterium]|nr:CDP-diacylglycerol--glycerol-3-phosphate 3-phosphatidyltransferase [Gammaproteobacteria bacterium]|tara:strand:+ start:1399 stop:1935 length:537 start_codon:yes stop_codon:yes gene_type:complete